MIEVTGDTEIIARLDAMPARLHAELRKRIEQFSSRMTSTVKRKLSGRVLNVRTGNLRDSIDYRIDDQPEMITGTVFSDKSVKYGAIHEFGGTTKPHVIEAKKGMLAFQAGGKTVFARRVNHPGSRIPSRPFMRPTLEEYRDTILASLKEAVQQNL